MKTVFNFSTALKAVFALFLFVAAGQVQAQVEVHVTNNSDTPLEVYVEGTNDCSTVSCSATETVDPSETITIELDCDYVVAAQVGGTGAGDPHVNLLTTLCACGFGVNIDTETLTIDTDSYDILQRCFGGGISIKID